MGNLLYSTYRLVLQLLKELVEHVHIWGKKVKVMLCLCWPWR